MRRFELLAGLREQLEALPIERRRTIRFAEDVGGAAEGPKRLRAKRGLGVGRTFE